jgi:putative peptidoglycan lipid II flippase
VSQRRSILRNTAIVSLFTMASRLLGLVREMMQSRLIGAGIEQSAFTLAFMIPNMARKLFGEGALTAAFVPVFKSAAERESLEKAALLARSVMTMVLLMLGAALLLLLGGLESFQRWISSHGSASERMLLSIDLIKTLLPYMVFICGAAFGMGVLNSLGRFKASSFMPCLLNVCWIAALGAISFFPEMPPAERVRWTAAAILAAGALQMAFMFWRMRKAGVSPLPRFTGWREGKVLQVWRNLAVAALGAGAIQINYVLDQVLSQAASEWAAGVIGYAERLMDLPLGVVGVAFGTVLLPTFSGFFARDDVDGARAALVSSVKSLMFVMLPSAAGLFVLAPEITSVVYQGGEFGPDATMRVSRALAVYALGLGFFGFQKSMIPWFQAQGDMKTPLRVSVVTVVLNAVLNILAVFLLPVEWRHVGLAASTVMCSASGCVLLVLLARRKNGSTGLVSCTVPVLKMSAASAAMACAVHFAKTSWSGLNPVFALTLSVAAGAAVYAVAAAALMRSEVRDCLRRRSAGRGVAGSK